MSRQSKGRKPSAPTPVVLDLSKRAIAVRPDPIPDRSLRRQLRLKVEDVNRLRGLLHQIPLGRGLHNERVAKYYPGYSFTELLRVIGLSGVMIADKDHHTGVSCNPKLDELVIEPNGSYRVVWAADDATPIDDTNLDSN